MADDPVTRILRRDPRYARAAYEFVGEALRIAIEEQGGERHVSARELLDAIRRLARVQLGPLARTVLADWGVHATDDFGTIVFNLIDEEAFGKTSDDRITDFSAVYDFDAAFPPETGVVRIQDDDDDLDLDLVVDDEDDLDDDDFEDDEDDLEDLL